MVWHIFGMKGCAMVKILVFSPSFRMRAMIVGILTSSGVEVESVTSRRALFKRCSEKLFDKLTEAGANTRLMYSIAGGHGFEPMHYGVEPQPGMPGVQEEIVKFILERA